MFSSLRTRRILVIVGMAATWLPVYERLLYPLNSTFNNTYDTTTYFFHVIYSLLVISIMLAIGIISLRANLKSLIANKGVLLSTGLGASFGILLLSQLNFSSTANLVIMGISVALVALYVPIHLLFWSQNFGKAAHKGTLSDAACSVALFEVIYALLLTFNVDTLTLAIAAPLVSAALGVSYLFIDPKEPYPCKEITPTHISVIMKSSLVFVVLCYLTVVYFNQSARLQADVPYRAFIHWGAMLMFIIIAWLYRPKKKKTMAKTSGFILVSLVYVGMLLITLFVPNETLNLATVPLNCASSVLVAFVWLLIIQSANKRRLSLISCMALYFSVFVFLPRFIQACIMYSSNYLTVFAQSINSLYIIATIVFAAIVLLIAGLLVLLNNRAVHADGDGGEAARVVGIGAAGTAIPDESSAQGEEIARLAIQHEKTLLALKDEAGFSNRELEIAHMAIKNKSAHRIAEELFISENTVYSHLKHIYQKTNVHSRQEFIDLVEGWQGKGR